MSSLVVTGRCSVRGKMTVPGDKSISHRALMVASIGSGTSTIAGLASGGDVASTIACLRSYGVDVDRDEAMTTVHGKGMRSFTAPGGPIDCGNSGSTMRMLAGLAAHHEFVSVFDGDASLRGRPMDRIVRPLRAFGAAVDAREGRFPPLRVEGGRLSAATIETAVPSAQVKSCALFAALAADRTSVVIEPRTSRDHTERMLAGLGATITSRVAESGAHQIEIEPFAPPSFAIDVPGDVSSASFVVAAAVLAGEIAIDGVGLNPTRTGFLETVERMGADVHADVTGSVMGEPVGRIVAARSHLRALDVDGSDPGLQDELPLIAVLATQADGTTTVRRAGELRVKESDRIATIVSGLRALGADIEETADGFVCSGPTVLSGATVAPAGDHRIAMALAVAALVAKGPTTIEGFEAATVSWPAFDRVLAELGADVELR